MHKKKLNRGWVILSNDNRVIKGPYPDERTIDHKLKQIRRRIEINKWFKKYHVKLKKQ